MDVEASLEEQDTSLGGCLVLGIMAAYTNIILRTYASKLR